MIRKRSNRAARRASLIDKALLAALLALALAAAACGGSAVEQAAEPAEEEAAEPAEEEEAEPEPEPEAAADPEKVTLRVSWWGGDFRHEYTQELLDLYMEQNPHVEIVGEFTGWGEYWDRLATVTAAGDAPDIAQQELRYVAEYAERGQLLDLTPLLGDSIDDSQLDPNVMPMGTIDGQVFAIPTGVNTYSIVVDPQIFAEAGVALPDDTTWTWDDYVEIAAEITANTPDGVYGTQEKAYNENDLEIYVRQRGQGLYDEDGLGFDPALMAEWWQTSVETRDTGGTPPADVTAEIHTLDIDGGLITTNKGAMGTWWSNQLGALIDGSGRDLKMLRFPGESVHDQPGMYFKASMYWAISSQTEHPEEAAKLMDFLINSQEVADITLTDRGLPTNLALRESIADKVGPADQQVIEFLADLADELADPPAPYPPGAGEIQSITQRLTEEILFDRMTVEQAVEQWLQEAEVALGG